MEEFEVDYLESGHPRVDAALDWLTKLPQIPLTTHPDIYDAVHTELRDIMSGQPAGARDEHA